ncbi:MAG: epoxyqueuosine reductase QueH [Clostridia bacterium]|nr:epoxyqueuosine reductase QueH [Clostridia bacterium]MDD4047218.1 epoxyqueuosine reductase QueH [Clostridia bacterium]
MKILLHACCGPCCIYPVDALRKEGHEIWGYSYNPNIHPYTEFIKRLETFKEYAEEINFSVIVDDNYGLEEYLRNVVFREGDRCRVCYSMRLRKTAQIARKGKFDAFTTTLLVSPFQNHQLIKDMGEAIGTEIGVPFYYQDFRPGFKEGVIKSKEENMYRQQYCGCIYSERDRYKPRKNK